jgi:hypothetical protein
LVDANALTFQYFLFNNHDGGKFDPPDRRRPRCGTDSVWAKVRPTGKAVNGDIPDLGGSFSVQADGGGIGKTSFVLFYKLLDVRNCRIQMLLYSKLRNS